MDAEIALEMDRERDRRLSTNSNNSSIAGTYVGPCSNSPEEVGRQCTCLLAEASIVCTLSCNKVVLATKQGPLYTYALVKLLFKHML